MRSEVSSVHCRYTYQDYLGIPEDPSRRHEIVDGELHVSAAPRFRHHRAYDRDLKCKRYLENGVAEVWIADAEERWVEVWRAGREEPLRRPFVPPDPGRFRHGQDRQRCLPWLERGRA